MAMGVVAAVLASVAALSVPPSAALAQGEVEVSGNRLANPGAEKGGPDGWEADGVGVLGYGQDGRVPALAYADRNRLGARLFAAGREGATLRQVVSLGDLAEPIDAGRQALRFGGELGGTGERPGSVRLSLEPLGADGTPLGSAYSTGAPTARDREYEAEMIGCGVFIRALPVGTRAARLTLTAVGPQTAAAVGLADRLYVTSRPLATPSVGQPAEAAHCIKLPPGGLAGPGPWTDLWQAVARPTRSRACSRRLRFAVRRDWITRVTRLTVVARGRSLSVASPRPGRGIDVRRSRHPMLVEVRVRFSDGTEQRRRVRFRGCRAPRAPTN